MPEMGPGILRGWGGAVGLHLAEITLFRTPIYYISARPGRCEQFRLQTHGAQPFGAFSQIAWPIY